MEQGHLNAVKLVTGPVSRRGFIGRCAAVPVAGAAIGVSATPALSAYRGSYAIDGHRVVDGYFASPRGRMSMDVVLVVPAAGESQRSVEAKARSFAAQGWLAIAPDLPKTYRTAALGGRPALVAAMMRDLPRFKGLAKGSGKVVVAA